MSKIRSYVVDADTDADIAGAALYLLNPDGTRKHVITTTDKDAYFEIEQPPFGTKIEVDFPGYAPTVFDPAYLLYGGIKLKADPSSTGGEVIVTGVRKKAAKKPDYTLPVILGSAAIITMGIWIYKSYG